MLTAACTVAFAAAQPFGEVDEKVAVDFDPSALVYEIVVEMVHFSASVAFFYRECTFPKVETFDTLLFAAAEEERPTRTSDKVITIKLTDIFFIFYVFEFVNGRVVLSK
jgi:hypothetical protein